MVRLTGGTHRGRVLPAGVPNTARPTSGRVREALFSMLGQDLRGWSMLDLFGGSGLMALEAASRGAGPVIVVERDARAAAIIRKNADGLGLNISVRVEDAARARLAESDVVFLDPPYVDDIGRWLNHAAPLARRFLVAEARAGTGFPALEGFVQDAVRSYGSTALVLYVRAGTDTGVEPAPEVREDGPVVEGEG